MISAQSLIMSARMKPWARRCRRRFTRPRRDPIPRLEDPLYANDFELRRVRSNGEIKWQGELMFIARPLVGEVIGLHEDNDGDAAVYFGPVQLGTINGVTLKFEPCARPPMSARVRRRRASCPQGPQPLGSL